MKKYIALFVCLFAVSISAQTENTAQIRQKTFEKVWQTVNDKYFDATFGGVDWKAIRTRYEPQVAAVKSDAELYELLNKMLGELKVSHLKVITPDVIGKLKQSPTTTGLSLREIENQIVITRLLENSSAARAGLKAGFVIKKIDGAAVEKLDDAKRKLAGAPNTTVGVAYLDEKDELREATLERLPAENAEKSEVARGISFYALFESKHLTGNIGYIRFSSFIAALNPKIEAAINSMKDAPGIIIDLRGNGGGDDSVAVRMAGMLFDKETQLMITKTREGEKFYYKAKPQKNPYPGRVAILIDESSGSASEQFAAGMQESGRAFVVGKTSEGGDMDASLMKLPTGAYLIYATGEPRTPKGVVIEGRGVIPNREVNLTRQGLLEGHDAQLEAAIEYIKNNR